MNYGTASSGQLCVQLEFVKERAKGKWGRKNGRKNVDEIMVRIFQNLMKTINL